MDKKFSKMQKIANEFETKNINKGLVTKVTDYSFTFTENPKKNKDEKTKSIVYYLSYFL